MSSTPRKDKILSPQEISLRKKIARDLIDSQLSIEQEYLTPLSKMKVGGGPDAIGSLLYTNLEQSQSRNGLIPLSLQLFHL